MVRRPPPRDTPSVSSNERVSTRLRILVVDDEPMVGAALRRTLSAHEVTVVTSGEAALAVIGGEPAFDVVICDVMMPGLTGPELYLAVCRAHPATSERFIFITGGVSSPESERSLKSIGRPVIPKPFDLHAMRELVQGFGPRED